MDVFKKYLSKSDPTEEPTNLNKPEDVRKVIEKVEVIDSIDVDAIHSQLNEIAEEKAAARLLDKSELQKSPLLREDKSKGQFLGLENLQKASEKPFIEPNQANESVPNKNLDVEIEKSNPFIESDNFTGFID